MRFSRRSGLLSVPLVLASLTMIFAFPATAVTIDFEGIPDSTPIRDMYKGLGVTFVRATAITAGVTLNELEFPPHSGTNVVFDNTGNILVDFIIPINTVSGYFTYAFPVTLFAYDSSGNILGSLHTQFSSNMLLSGDMGSTPNEFLEFNSSTSIASLSITGDPNGSSFVIDDFAFGSSQIPEPTTAMLVFAGLIIVINKWAQSDLNREGGHHAL